MLYFSKDILDGSVELLLANALYFKGTWSSPFKQEKTSDKPFKLDDGRETSVPTMHRKAFLIAGEMVQPGFKWIELPFQVSKFCGQVGSGITDPHPSSSGPSPYIGNKRPGGIYDRLKQVCANLITRADFI